MKELLKEYIELRTKEKLKYCSLDVIKQKELVFLVKVKTPLYKSFEDLPPYLKKNSETINYNKQTRTTILTVKVPEI